MAPSVFESLSDSPSHGAVAAPLPTRPLARELKCHDAAGEAPRSFSRRSGACHWSGRL